MTMTLIEKFLYHLKTVENEPDSHTVWLYVGTDSNDPRQLTLGEFRQLAKSILSDSV